LADPGFNILEIMLKKSSNFLFLIPLPIKFYLKVKTLISPSKKEIITKLERKKTKEIMNLNF